MQFRDSGHEEARIITECIGGVKTTAIRSPSNAFQSEAPLKNAATLAIPKVVEEVGGPPVGVIVVIVVGAAFMCCNSPVSVRRESESNDAVRVFGQAGSFSGRNGHFIESDRCRLALVINCHGIITGSLPSLFLGGRLLRSLKNDSINSRPSERLEGTRPVGQATDLAAGSVCEPDLSLRFFRVHLGVRGQRLWGVCAASRQKSN